MHFVAILDAILILDLVIILLYSLTPKTWILIFKLLLFADLQLRYDNRYISSPSWTPS